MKKIDSTKPKYIPLFKVVTLLMNFLHRHHMDLTNEVIDEHMPIIMKDFENVFAYYDRSKPKEIKCQKTTFKVFYMM
jgi:hypothetical protein